MLTGSEPRVSATGEGRIEFDRALGMPKRVELECKTVAVTENLSRRSVITLRWQLLEGAEREKAHCAAAAAGAGNEVHPGGTREAGGAIEVGRPAPAARRPRAS